MQNHKNNDIVAIRVGKFYTTSYIEWPVLKITITKGLYTCDPNSTAKENLITVNHTK